MSNVKNYTDDQILNRVESLSTFKGWKKGKYEILISSLEDEFNKFDDKAYSFECLKDGEKPTFKFVQSCTVNAGSSGLLNFEKYGNKRCAVLKPDHMEYDAWSFGKHRGEYDAYRQVKAWPYIWDDNHNKIAGDSNKIVEGEIIHANMHKAGKHSTDINGNSIACIVRPIEEDFNKWMKYMNKEIVKGTVILKEW